MNEYPILFTDDMVRAILDGRKSQTRRVMKPQPILVKHDDEGSHVEWSCPLWPRLQVDSFDDLDSYGPYGMAGDRLWVRERWTLTNDEGAVRIKIPKTRPRCYGLAYHADGHDLSYWRPSIHMPRWACRIRLEVINVRVEQVQEIIPEEAIAEGIAEANSVFMHAGWKLYDNSDHMTTDPVRSFRTLWDRINTLRGYPWVSNPWVWVVSFKPAERSAA